MRTISKLSILFIGIIIFNTNLQSQYLYSSREIGFSIDFPASYETEKTEQESAVTVKISTDFDGHTFFASYSLHEVEMVEHEQMAEVSLESFTEAVGGEIISQKTWKMDGHKGLKAILNLPASDVKVEYRVILVGNTQYQILVLAPNASYDKKAAKEFLESFELL